MTNTERERELNVDMFGSNEGSGEHKPPAEDRLSYGGLMDKVNSFTEVTGIRVFNEVMADIQVGMLEGSLTPIEAVKILREISSYSNSRWSLEGAELSMEARSRAYTIATSLFDKPTR